MNDASNKNYFVSNFYAVIENDGLLAKLLNYEGVTNCPTDESSQEGKTLLPLGGEFLIVNWENLIVNEN